MFKTLLKILVNRAKVGLANFLLEILIGTLTEFQRSNARGDFDLNFQSKQDAYESNFNNPLNIFKNGNK